MPLYNYECKECGFSRKKLRKLSEFNIEDQFECDECEGKMYYKLPSSLSTQTHDTNKYRGTTQKRGVQGQLRKRMKKHDMKYEYKDQIDQFGLDNTKHIIDKVEKV